MAMKVFGVSVVRSRFSTLVEEASRGQAIGITRRGKLVAMITPAHPQASLKEIFRNLDKIRKRSKMPEGVTVKDLIEEGRV